MGHLLPCPGCSRHVRALDAICPFCGDALPASLRTQMKPRLPTKRMGRSAILAFGAALTAAGCGDPGTNDDDAGRMALDAGSEESDAGKDGGMASETDAGFDAGQNVALYGGPAVDSGMAPGDDAGMDAGPSITPLYGGPSLIDAGNEGPPDGAVVALYGAPA